ncbi:MAG: hypothetical protein DCC73_12255 [Proteobacteria bacterium]|nr:MAG: hypothetical protein DCC73_12255 [Pseudomonadota bacterium]
MMMKTIGLILGLFLMLAPAALAAGSPSAASPWQSTPYGRTRLIAAMDGVGPGAQALAFGWQVELADGWKTYWRSPGEAGLPPRLQWRQSGNIAGLTVAWPLPERYSLYGYDTAVYRGEVVLPLTVALREPGKSATLDLAVDYMVCKEVCVPLQARYVLSLPAKEAPAQSRESHAIAAYAAAVPKMGLAEVKRVAFDPQSSALLIEAALRLPSRRITDVFVIGPDDLAFGRASGNGGSPLQVPVMGRSPAAVAGRTITLVFADDQGAGYAWSGAVAATACLSPSLQQC